MNSEFYRFNFFFFFGSVPEQIASSVVLPLPQPLTPCAPCVQRCFVVCVPKVSEINILIYELSTDMVSSSNYLITSLGPSSEATARYIQSIRRPYRCLFVEQQKLRIREIWLTEQCKDGHPNIEWRRNLWC